MNWSIDDVSILTPEEALKNGFIEIEGDSISSVSKKQSTADIRVEIENGVAVPGLVNSHDHLLGTYYPKVGNGPYENWLPWDNDLKSAPLYQERQQIENRDLYLMGAYRNLLSGVTTVSDHIPPFVAEPFYDMLPMKAIRNYALVHSIASFALNWGESPSSEYKKAVDNDIPFITHISEGLDAETRQDVQVLKRLGGLGDHSVLVHGLSFSKSDIDSIKEADASVVWCGDSNMFMYEQTTDIEYLLKKDVNVCIGTDSPMSGGLNLLHEMKFDRDLYAELTGKKLSDEKIVRMVTSNPAHAFRMHRNGAVKKGNLADLTVVRDRGGSPWSSVVDAEMEDILLVVIDGLPVYGLAGYAYLFDELGVGYQHIVLKGSDRIITGDLIGLLKRVSRAVGFKKELPFLPVEFDF